MDLRVESGVFATMGRFTRVNNQRLIDKIVCKSYGFPISAPCFILSLLSYPRILRQSAPMLPTKEYTLIDEFPLEIVLGVERRASMKLLGISQCLLKSKQDCQGPTAREWTVQESKPFEERVFIGSLGEYYQHSCSHPHRKIVIFWGTLPSVTQYPPRYCMLTMSHACLLLPSASLDSKMLPSHAVLLLRLQLTLVYNLDNVSAACYLAQL